MARAMAPSRAHTRRLDKALGMTPAAWRAGGAGTRVRFAVVEQGTGLVLVAATDEGVCAIELGDDAAELEARLRRHLPAAVIERHDADVAVGSRAPCVAPSCRLRRSNCWPTCATSPFGRGSGASSGKALARGRKAGSVSPRSRGRCGCPPRRDRRRPLRTPGDACRPRAAWLTPLQRLASVASAEGPVDDVWRSLSLVQRTWTAKEHDRQR